MNRERWNRFRRRARSEIMCPLFELLIFSAKVMPWWWTRAICSGLGRLAYYVIPRDRKRTITHLTMAYGAEFSEKEIRAMAKQNFRDLGRNFADFMISQSLNTKEELAKLVTIDGEEHVVNALAKGKGVIIVTCHLSVFELILTYGARRYPSFAVGARLDDKRMNDMLMKDRTRLGATIIYKGEANMQLFRALKKGGLLGLLIDQDTSVKSVHVDFFGRPAATPMGAALLAQKTGSPVVVAAVQRIGKYQHITVTPEIEIAQTGDLEADIKTNTQAFTSEIETFVRQTPTQWVWMHRRWRTQPETESASVGTQPAGAES